MTAIFDSVPTLQQLEAVIERGLSVYTEVAAALQQIHDRKLYRPAYESFDAYCQTRWRFSAKRAYQLLTAARVVGEMSTTVDTGVPPPSNERQIRELARIADPQQRDAVWQNVVAEHRPSATSQDVQNAVDRHLAGDDAADFVRPGATVADLQRLDTPAFFPARTDSEGSEKVSDGYTKEVPSERKLRFHSAREIAEMTPERPPWIAVPWLVAGGITELDGKIKASGKTTFATYMCRAILDGLPFLGRPTKKSPVVYLTEQSRTTFREALRRADLLDRDDFRAIFWNETTRLSWPEIVREARAEAKEIGARVIIVDTLDQFAGIVGDDENSAGAARLAMRPLQEATATDDLAVKVLRHERKAGGSVGDSARGSSAFGGAADILLRLKRGEGNTRPTVRVLDALSRFDETPDTLVIELTEDKGYIAHGDVQAVATHEAAVAILAAAPTTEDKALREEDLLDAAGATVKRTTGRQAIHDHLDAGRLRCTGNGKRGDPFRYWRPDPEEVSDGTPSLYRSETNDPRDDAADDPDSDQETVSDGTTLLYRSQTNGSRDPPENTASDDPVSDEELLSDGTQVVPSESNDAPLIEGGVTDVTPVSAGPPRGCVTPKRCVNGVMCAHARTYGGCYGV